MNPWETLGWIAAVCLSILIIVITLLLVLHMVRDALKPKPSRTTSDDASAVAPSSSTDGRRIRAVDKADR